MREFTKQQATDTIEIFESDLEKFHLITITAEILADARNLIRKHGPKGLRTLDAIQLASTLQVKSELDYALTSDQTLRKIMKAEGLKTDF